MSLRLGSGERWAGGIWVVPVFGGMGSVGVEGASAERVGGAERTIGAEADGDGAGVCAVSCAGAGVGGPGGGELGSVGVVF